MTPSVHHSLGALEDFPDQPRYEPDVCIAHRADVIGSLGFEGLRFTRLSELLGCSSFSVTRTRGYSISWVSNYDRGIRKSVSKPLSCTTNNCGLTFQPIFENFRFIKKYVRIECNADNGTRALKYSYCKLEIYVHWSCTFQQKVTK